VTAVYPQLLLAHLEELPLTHCRWRESWRDCIRDNDHVSNLVFARFGFCPARLKGLRAYGMSFACIRNFPHTLRVSVAQKSVAYICQNGLSGCAHWCLWPLCVSASEMTLACIRFKVTKTQHLDPNIRNFAFYCRGFTTESVSLSLIHSLSHSISLSPSFSLFLSLSLSLVLSLSLSVSLSLSLSLFLFLSLSLSLSFSLSLSLSRSLSLSVCLSLSLSLSLSLFLSLSLSLFLSLSLSLSFFLSFSLSWLWEPLTHYVRGRCLALAPFEYLCLKYQKIACMPDKAG